MRTTIARPRTPSCWPRCAGSCSRRSRKSPPGRTTAKAEHRKHWFRAKFGAGRFRLFFRYSTRAKIIVFAWVNDEATLRTYGARSDAYAVFRKMLDKGDPPDAPGLSEGAIDGGQLDTEQHFSPKTSAIPDSDGSP